MELREFFAEDAVQLDLKGESKDEILKELIGLLGVDEKSQGILFKMLKRRENLGSTGIGRGIAIPHCRSLVVNRLRVAFGRKPEPVEYRAIDDQPVQYFFLIVAPPLVWRTRLSWVYTFGLRKQHSIGPAVDFLDVPKRDDSMTIRVGPILRMQLSRRVDVRGSFIFTIMSPDRIGLRGGDFTELGLRYRWASE